MIRGQERKIKKPKATLQAGLIPRPDVTTAHIVLLTLAQRGRLGFRDIVSASVSQNVGQRTENSFYTALARLKQRRQIIRTTDRRYELTQTGEYAALKAFVRKELVALELKQGSARGQQQSNSRWDGKWRIAIFDIPESKRPLRDYLRNILKRVGCMEFQRSMWIYPYRLPLFITKLFEDPQIRRYARLITALNIDYDDDLCKKFKIR